MILSVLLAITVLSSAHPATISDRPCDIDEKKSNFTPPSCLRDQIACRDSGMVFHCCDIGQICDTGRCASRGTPTSMSSPSQVPAPSQSPNPVSQVSCLDPDADIAGIGVRYSTYIQAFLSFVPALIVVLDDGHLDLKEEQSLRAIFGTQIFTTCALLIASGIRAARGALTMYHALIVLNLCWMLTMGSLIICIFPFVESYDDATQHHRFLLPHSVFLQSIFRAPSSSQSIFRHPYPLSQLFFCLLVSIQVAGMASLGWVTWSRQLDACEVNVLTSTFMHNIAVTTRSIRSASRVIYGIMLVPFYNVPALVIVIIVPATAVGILAKYLLKYRLWKLRSNSLMFYLAIVFVQSLFTILFIIDTQRIVRTNRSLLVIGNESEWGFGQILAMLLTAFPLWEVWIVAFDMLCKQRRWPWTMLLYVLWIIRVPWMGDWDTLSVDIFRDIDEARSGILCQTAILEPLDTIDIRAASAALKATVSALEAAGSAINVVDIFLHPGRDRPSFSSVPEYPTRPTLINRISRARRLVVIASSIRSEHAKEPLQFATTKACFEAAQTALTTAQAALEGAYFAINTQTKPVQSIDSSTL